jgi:hypothetical protein
VKSLLFPPRGDAADIAPQAEPNSGSAHCLTFLEPQMTEYEDGADLVYASAATCRPGAIGATAPSKRLSVRDFSVC